MPDVQDIFCVTTISQSTSYIMFNIAKVGRPLQKEVTRNLYFSVQLHVYNVPGISARFFGISAMLCL